MPEVTPFQVLIVDDHPLMRRGIRQLLELDPAFYVVAEAGDGASAIDLANRIEPDLILLDLNMKGLSGLDTLNALRRDGVTAQIIILTVSDSASATVAGRCPLARLSRVISGSVNGRVSNSKLLL